VSSFPEIMRIPYPLFEFKLKAISLTTAAAIIMAVLLAANVTITNAQQQEQQQLSTGQPSTAPITQNSTMATTASFESIQDSFRVQLPEGWVIQDVNNTGFTLAAEATQGYGILAQLCPEGEGRQQQGPLTNVSSRNSSCQQQGQEEVIHIIRYPNLDTRLGITLDDVNTAIPRSIVLHQNRMLQEVGYRDIEIVNSTRARMNVNYTTTEGVPAAAATVPARLIEITYSTSSAPNEVRRGYLLLTATNATPPSLETITGYSIFYEGIGANATEQTTTPSGNLLLPPSFRQVIDSFELIPSEEAGEIILALAVQQAMGNEPNDQVEEAGEAGEAEEAEEAGEAEEAEEAEEAGDDDE
jgi:hypothetical protein